MNIPSTTQQTDSPASLPFSKTRALALLTALSGILLVYLGALVASALTVVFLTGRLFIVGPGIVEALVLIAGIGVSSLLTVVLAKGLFRHTEIDTGEFVELTAETEPEFFAFLTDICARCDAPMPDQVFAFPDVNAGVFVEVSVLRLFRPAKKHLLVGLGMINTLNRTEIEAVLAHEFGHFSQRTLGLHHYVQALTGVFQEVVRGRDTIDHKMAQWRERRFSGLGLPIAVMAATNLVRKVCIFLHETVQRLEASVNRQMELQADAVAVELTGSDALIHALVRTDWADRCFKQTLYDLEQAAEDGLRSDDLYFHQRHLIEAMREHFDDPTLGRPPRLPDDEKTYISAFAPSEDEQIPRAALWDSHPPHLVREENARRDYRRTKFDDRSAWSLFSDADALRATVTDRVYTHRWANISEAESAAVVQHYLDGEHAEVLLTVDDRAVYGHRFLEPGDLEEIIAAACDFKGTDDDLRCQLQHLTGPELAEAAQRVARHVSAPATSQTSEAVPQAPGARPLRSPAASEPAPPSEPSAEADRDWLANWDHRLMVATLCAARRQKNGSWDELIERYRFHLHLQDLVRWIREHTTPLSEVMIALSNGDVDEETIETIFSVLSVLHNGLSRGLNDSPTLPDLHGLPPSATLTMLVLDEPLLDRSCLDDGRLDNTWLAQFTEQWQRASQRLDHLRRKSLGALLLYQKQIHTDWLD